MDRSQLAASAEIVGTESATTAALPVDVFLARCEARAILVRWSYLDLPDAVDGLQAAAIASGLVTELGQDRVQAIMSAAFADVDQDEAGPPEVLPKQRSDRAAESTVEALLFCLRERGAAALSERACLDRLAALSNDQVRAAIARLIALRPRYSNINDDLIFKLGEQLL